MKTIVDMANGVVTAMVLKDLLEAQHLPLKTCRTAVGADSRRCATRTPRRASGQRG